MTDLAEVPVLPRVAVSGFDDAWRRWIAENLMLGVAAESLVPKLVEQGLTTSLVAGEIALAASSPYLQGSQRLQNRLKKREWILECYSRLHRLLPQVGRVDVPHDGGLAGIADVDSSQLTRAV